MSRATQPIEQVTANPPTLVLVSRTCLLCGGPGTHLRPVRVGQPCQREQRQEFTRSCLWGRVLLSAPQASEDYAAILGLRSCVVDQQYLGALGNVAGTQQAKRDTRTEVL